MAIDTVAGAIFSLVLRVVMTVDAFGGKCGQHSFLVLMWVVAGEAGHLAALETFAGGEQTVLISVYVDAVGVRRAGWNGKKCG